MVIFNRHDARYKFRLTDGGVVTCIKQLGKHPSATIWHPVVWSQWSESKTTKTRAQTMMGKLANTNPNTKWFKRTVVWVY